MNYVEDGVIIRSVGQSMTQLHGVTSHMTVRQEHPQCRHLADETQTSSHRDINIQAQKSVE